MFTWISLALTLLKIVNNIMTWARERELVSEGYDQALGEVAQQIFSKTTAGKAIMEKVNAMSDADVDAELGKLD